MPHSFLLKLCSSICKSTHSSPLMLLQHPGVHLYPCGLHAERTQALSSYLQKAAGFTSDFIESRDHLGWKRALKPSSPTDISHGSPLSARSAPPTALSQDKNKNKRAELLQPCPPPGAMVMFPAALPLSLTKLPEWDCVRSSTQTFVGSAGAH